MPFTCTCNQIKHAALSVRWITNPMANEEKKKTTSAERTTMDRETNRRRETEEKMKQNNNVQYSFSSCKSFALLLLFLFVECLSLGWILKMGWKRIGCVSIDFMRKWSGWSRIASEFDYQTDLRCWWKLKEHNYSVLVRAVSFSLPLSLSLSVSFARCLASSRRWDRTRSAKTQTHIYKNCNATQKVERKKYTNNH